MKCSGGCGKEVSNYPGATVTCIDCALEASRKAREAYRETAIKSERLDV